MYLLLPFGKAGRGLCSMIQQIKIAAEKMRYGRSGVDFSKI